LTGLISADAETTVEKLFLTIAIKIDRDDCGIRM
jgi:hypothetical protein